MSIPGMTRTRRLAGKESNLILLDFAVGRESAANGGLLDRVFVRKGARVSLTFSSICMDSSNNAIFAV